MNRRLLFVVAVLVALTVPIALVGQDKTDAAPMSITGCLNKGADAMHYVIKDEKGKETVVMGDAAMLDRHANNHNVTLTGNMGKDKTMEVLKATDLKMNSMCK